MRYLYIDTSSNYLYSAIIEDDKEISVIKEEYGQSLSEVALPRIVSMFEENGLTAKDIDKIIVVNGPGSFTGIRIGITIAKVYAWGLNIPISTLSSLEAMAISSETDKVHIPMIYARRNNVYTAAYDKNNNEIIKAKHTSINNMLDEIKENNIENYEIISNDDFELQNEKIKYNPNILKIVQTVGNRDNINPHAVNPEYLKLTAAEESKL